MTRTVSLLAAVLALGASAAHAQAFKVGYVDTDQIVIRMPAFADVQTQLQQQQQAVGQRVRFVQDSLGQVLQTRVADYETFAQSAVATDEARRERQVELVQLQGSIERTEAEGLQYLSYVEARLLQPVLTQVDEAITAEAEANSYDLILPTVANNAPVFLYRSARVADLTVAVMERLGIDPESQPLTRQQQAQPTSPAAVDGQAPGGQAPGGR